jgi:Concanavalin A-like lectin/glucanases superfamily
MWRPLLTVASALRISLLSLASPVAAASIPESPAFYPDVVPEVAGRPVHGHLSEQRSTQDGRVRINGNGDKQRVFYTARPELLRRPVAEDWRQIDGKRTRLAASLFHRSTAAGATVSHSVLCDPFLAAGTRRNPFVCTHNGQPADCYDVSVIQLVQVPEAGATQRHTEIWSTPARITVRSPKTLSAQVAKVELLGDPVLSPITALPRRAGEDLLEPVVSGDGRLILFNSGDTLLYSVMDEGETSCDARNWRRLDHISSMARDPRMAPYGIARYPLRDSENRPIPAGRPVRGAYPWIDREARNLFFMQVAGEGFFYRDRDGQLQTRYPISGEPPKSGLDLQPATRFGMSWLGLWSQGKIVVPDTRVSGIDHHLGNKRYEPRVRLYRDAPDGTRLSRATIIALNSPETEWNYLSALRARSPHDVVWWLSGSNGMTDEVVFDDALDAGTLIFSPMNAAVNNTVREWRDGFDYKKLTGYTKVPRIQNAAASTLRWKLPAFGKLVEGRIEPIAAGGFRGKGLWLDGTATRLAYSIPQQGSGMGRMTEATWATSLWIDPRVEESTGRRRLTTFPDGSWVDIESERLLVGNGAGERPIALPTALRPRAGAWTHLAFLSTPSRLELYVDGFRLAGIDGSWLRLRPGTLSVGRPAAGASDGFNGWIDELRVSSGSRDPEVLCNWAAGTLRGIDPVGDGAAFAAAADYPPDSHDRISARLATAGRRTFPRYRCETERDDAHTCLASIHDPLAADPSCVHAALLFPEGPLFSDRPRPDSRSNLFCQSCHTELHPTPGLRVEGPLRPGPPGTSLADDRRRQPFQTPLRVHGIVPAGLLGNAEEIEAPPGGLALDPWLVPSASGASGSQPPR